MKTLSMLLGKLNVVKKEDEKTGLEEFRKV